MLAPKNAPTVESQPELQLLPVSEHALQSRWIAGSAKRTLDLGIAVCALLAAVPMVALSALLIIALDRQLPFYGDTRVGMGGRRFRCWKLRTMRSDPAILEAYFTERPDEERRYQLTRKLEHDPRITSVGRVLRKTSLDELPQVVNVLRGDMSIVGPRPLSPAEFDRRGPDRFPLASVRPGLTGLWQVSGRSDLDPASRVLLDNYYARHWSIWMDLRILAATPVAVLTARGAR